MALCPHSLGANRQTLLASRRILPEAIGVAFGGHTRVLKRAVTLTISLY